MIYTNTLLISTMKFYYLNAAILAANVLTLVHANNSDRFNYGDTDGKDFGLEDWNKVSCDDPTKCVSATIV